MFWEDLRKAKVGDFWKFKRFLNSYEATVIFKDNKGVLIRFGIARYDDLEMEYYTEYYHFIKIDFFNLINQNEL